MAFEPLDKKTQSDKKRKNINTTTNAAGVSILIKQAID